VLPACQTPVVLEQAERKGGALPVGAVLPALLTALGTTGAAVLVSPPGTGKTTLVPLALADAVPGRVIVAEPRRVAARAAARRMAWLLGEEVGERVGYTVRGDRLVGPDTRVEVVTTGVLVQRLQRDAELPGTGAVMLDECHERHLDTDLALAFAVETRAALRPDLMLLAASATADSDRLAALVDGQVVGADAPLHEVRTIWAPPRAPLDPPQGLRVDPKLLDHVAGVVRRALAETTGDVLVFLPGAGEIDQVARRLDGVRTVRLHGRLSNQEQDAALRATTARRVVLATSIAETSLTVPGVRTVVDAGLARVPRLDLARGLGSLVTVRVSRSAAHQRAGRAGREAPGQVYRCWSEADHTRLPAHPEPEIATADLTAFALALARWGDPDAVALPLLDRPPEAAATVARQTLLALGAVGDDGRITARGRRLAAVGVHPRLARALLDGAPLVGDRRAAELVAVLAEDAPTGPDDLAALHRQTRGRLRDEARRLHTAARLGEHRTTSAGELTGKLTDDLAAGIVAGLAFPERLARRRGAGYLMAGGTGGELAPGSGLSSSPWLAVAVAQRRPGAANARIRLAAAIDEATALEVGAAQRRTDDEVHWADGDVVARRVERLGAIVLSEKPLRDVPRERLRAALRNGLAKDGLGLLTWTEGARALRARLALLHRALDWPDVSDRALLDAAEVWLGPELAAARGRADLRRIDVATALRRLLDHRQGARLNELAPERVAVPSGSNVRLHYDDHYDDPAAPVLAVKLQETFGWRSTPRIAGDRVPVVLHLLSPAGRPLAVTSDLASFWVSAYPAVRGEMRGRYPKHPWPEDPAAATPTARTKRRTH
jgi:ATP-dependent RNA helicase HrpB